MKARKARIPVGLRRSMAVVAVGALLIGGIKIGTEPDSSLGVLGLPGATADPTGPMPTGGMGPGGMNGSQFSPPALPPQQPDYQGGNNLPPLNQDSGVSIYNTGSPGAQQVPQQGAQQAPAQNQQPAHGTQPPDYQTATPFTQGPGRANPDYQAPQQNSPQQPQQGQQQEPQQQQPQNKQDDTTQQLDQQKQQKCMNAATNLGYMSLASGGGGSLDMLPQDPLTPLIPCNGACQQLSQPGGKHAIQKNIPPQKADDPKAQQQIDQLKKAVEDQAKKCGVTDIVGDVAQIASGVAGVIVSLPAVAVFGIGLIPGVAAGWVVVDGISKIADCTRSSEGIHRIEPGK
ncbi:hypothetical protein QMY57_25755 (plasmid) [Mycobacteroides abscessus subsp. abscessus]|uniref:hypothetical protein n=1 Tax=Mycobacteroides abscessus TaxID=36809 RepID=UPI0039772E52